MFIFYSKEFKITISLFHWASLKEVQNLFISFTNALCKNAVIETERYLSNVITLGLISRKKRFSERKYDPVDKSQ